MKLLFRGLFLLTLSIFPANDLETIDRSFPNESAGNNSGLKATWELFQSPSINNLHKIIMISPRAGYILGRSISSYDGREWKKLELQPDIPGITDMFVNKEGSLWITYFTNYNESEVFHFNGRQWEEVDMPFANAVTYIAFSQNNIEWIGGDREIARREGSSWKLVPFPDSYAAINFIYPLAGGKAWVTTNDLKLFYFNGRNWTRYLKDEKIIQAYFESPSVAYFLTSGKLIKYDRLNFSTHSENEYLKDVFKLSFLPDGEIWGIGSKGLVVHWNLKKWEKVESPEMNEYADIAMVSPSEGWIVGNDGMILHYAAAHENKSQNREMGFNPVKISSASKDIVDEYGVAIDDINNDGLKDVYAVCIFDPNKLYINISKFDTTGRIQSPLFNEEASARGVTGVSNDTSSVNFRELDLGVGLADVDNDGDLDIYLCNLLGKNKLLLNNGNGYFRNVSNEVNRGIGENERTNAAVFGDVDNDGDLDLFITNENSTNRLYLNNGSGYFTEVTGSAGLISKGGGMGAEFCDIDGDGKLDLFVCNWAKHNLLYHNVSAKGKVHFEDITDSAGVGGEGFSKSNAVVFFDYDNDGLPDLFVTSRKRSNRLYHNLGNCRFEDVTEQVIGIDSMLSYGAAAADFDQDGYQDLYVANVGDNVFYKNIGGKKLVPMTAEYGAQMGGYSTGCATGDIDNDGDVDLYVANYLGGNSILFLNNCNNRNFLKLNVKGTISNRDAVGTQIKIYKAGHAGDKNYLIGYREISGGSGYGSYSAREVHFGTGSTNKLDAVIYFPASGIKRTLSNISAGTTLTVSEEENAGARITLFSKALNRVVSDPDVHRETLKFILVLLLISFSAYRGKKKYNWRITKQFIFHSAALLIYWIQILLIDRQNFILADLLPIISVFVMLAIIHLIYERVILAKINKLEKQATRDRIARDLHDDLASTLSSSVIYNEALRRLIKNPSKEESDLIQKIGGLLSEASEAITDIVWAVSPTHDKMDDLVLRIRRFISDCCKTNQIAHEIINEVDEPDISLPEDVRRNVYLIFKEAINNISKYARPSKVKFTARLNHKHLDLILEDDGVGFPVDEYLFDDGQGRLISKVQLSSLHGHGLINMAHRAKEINGQLRIESSPGRGTRISLSCKMT